MAEELNYRVRNPDGSELAGLSEEQVCAEIERGGITLESFVAKGVSTRFVPITQFVVFAVAFESRMGLVRGEHSTSDSTPVSNSGLIQALRNEAGESLLSPISITRPNIDALEDTGGATLKTAQSITDSEPITHSDHRVASEDSDPATHAGSTFEEVSERTTPPMPAASASLLADLKNVLDAETEPPFPKLQTRATLDQRGDLQAMARLMSDPRKAGPLPSLSHSDPDATTSPPEDSRANLVIPVFQESRSNLVIPVFPTLGDDPDLDLTKASPRNQVGLEPKDIRIERTDLRAELRAELRNDSRGSEPRLGESRAGESRSGESRVELRAPRLESIEPTRIRRPPTNAELLEVGVGLGAWTLIFVLLYLASHRLALGQAEARSDPASLLFWVRAVLLTGAGALLIWAFPGREPLSARDMSFSTRWAAAAVVAGLLAGLSFPAVKPISLPVAVPMAVIAAVSEEIFFRGFIGRTLEATFHRPTLSVGMAAALYGAYATTHYAVWVDPAPIAVILRLLLLTIGAGLPFALLHHWTRSLIPPLICHASLSLALVVGGFLR